MGVVRRLMLSIFGKTTNVITTQLDIFISTKSSQWNPIYGVNQYQEIPSRYVQPCSTCFPCVWVSLISIGGSKGGVGRALGTISFIFM